MHEVINFQNNERKKNHDNTVPSQPVFGKKLTIRIFIVEDFTEVEILRIFGPLD